MILLLILLLLLPPATVGAGDLRSGAKRIVVLGVDGLSTDGLQTAATPAIDALIRRGAFTLRARGVMPTVSAPNWSSMLTGAGPEQHGITSNSWKRDNFTIEPTARDEEGFFPSIFTLLRSARPQCEMGFFYDWDELGELVNRKALNTFVFTKSYKETVAKATEYIVAKRPDLTFVYISEPDEVGHEHGHFTPRYYAEIESVDAHIGQLIGAMKRAGLYEETNFFLITDHGGVGFGHGGETMNEIEIPWLVSGPGVVADQMIAEPVNAMQTAPTIAWLFGLTPPVEWIARPVLGAFAEDQGAAHTSYVPKPHSSLKDGLYTEPTPFTLTSKDPDAVIRWTFDGSEPTASSQPSASGTLLARSATVKAAAFRGASKSVNTVVHFVKVDGVKGVTFAHQPSPRYTGSGPLGLVDGKRGTANYRDKNWMGFEGYDLEATIDFGAERELHRVTLEFLQDKNSWIFLPAAVEFFAAEADSARLIVAPRDSSGIVTVMNDFHGLKTRLLRVRAVNIGLCPAGLPGSGEKAWLFVDELTIE